jgi:DNA-binding MarR family transcriptional regulator
MDDPFTLIEHAAWGGLLGTFGRMSTLIDADLRERFGLSHVEFEVLLRLATSRAGRMRIQDLAARSILTRSGMSRAVDRLERSGYLTRERASEDRRGAYASLTGDGRRRFERVAAEHAAFVREHFLSLFDERELAQMAGFWERVSVRAGSVAGPAPTAKGSRPWPRDE